MSFHALHVHVCVSVNSFHAIISVTFREAGLCDSVGCASDW